MTLSDFITSLEMELRLRAIAFDRSELETWAAEVWSLAEGRSRGDQVGRGVPGGAAGGGGGVSGGPLPL
jgi:hypothetical protein